MIMSTEAEKALYKTQSYFMIWTLSRGKRTFCQHDKEHYAILIGNITLIIENKVYSWNQKQGQDALSALSFDIVLEALSKAIRKEMKGIPRWKEKLNNIYLS